MTGRELALTMAEPKARTRELDAFEERMVLHQRQVLMTALRLLGNLDDAKDAAQEVFYRLYKHRARIDPDKPLSPWLYRVTVNVCADLRRKRSELPLPETVEVAGSAADLDDGLDLAARRRLVQHALLHLPEKERAAVVLREIEGLSTRDVAEALGSSEATVRSQVSAGRRKLRDLCAALLRKKP